MRRVSSFYSLHKEAIHVAMGVGVGFFSFVILQYFNVPVAPPLECAADRVLRAFEEGRGVQAPETVAHVDRQQLNEDLSLILRPQKSNKYCLIVGEKGTGKTTAVSYALSTLPDMRGAIYIMCPLSARLFSLHLKEVTDCMDPADVSGGMRRRLEGATKEEKGPDLDKEPLATFEQLISPLTAAAVTFKARHGRPAVLVIDGADFLAQQCPAFLGNLQDFAKISADSTNLRVVFVSSDGTALPLLTARSTSSRMSRPYEIGEISDDQATDYLVRRGERPTPSYQSSPPRLLCRPRFSLCATDDCAGVSRNDAELAVANLTGGLFAALDNFAEALLLGFTYQQLLEEMDRGLRKRMKTVDVSASHAVFRELARDGFVPLSRTDDLRMTQGLVDRLLAKNILSMRPNNTYTFHDRHVAKWFRRQHAATRWPFTRPLTRSAA
jgi:hypothetical protein